MSSVEQFFQVLQLYYCILLRILLGVILPMRKKKEEVITEALEKNIGHAWLKGAQHAPGGRDAPGIAAGAAAGGARRAIANFRQNFA